MKRIHKFPLEITDRQTVALPRGSKILSTLVQDNRLMLYAVIDDEEGRFVDRRIWLHGTGHEARVFSECEASRFIFIGTRQMSVRGMNLVWHIFADEE